LNGQLPAGTLRGLGHSEAVGAGGSGSGGGGCGGRDARGIRGWSRGAAVGDAALRSAHAEQILGGQGKSGGLGRGLGGGGIATAAMATIGLDLLAILALLILEHQGLGDRGGLVRFILLLGQLLEAASVGEGHQTWGQRNKKEVVT